MTALISRSALPSAAVAAILLSANASAQSHETATGSRLSRPAPARARTDVAGKPLEAQRMFASFATCVVRRSPRLVSAYLEQRPFTDASAKLEKAIIDNECLYGADMRFAVDLFRGAVFDALYARDFARAAPPSPAAGVTIDYAAEVPGLIDPRHISYVFGRTFADCVYRDAPGPTRAMLLSEAGSAAESRAFAALMPTLGKCLDTGQTLAFGRAGLRGYLAEVAYRLAQPATALPSSSSGTVH